MTDDGKTVVPVFALATKSVSIPDVGFDGILTPERLSELRTVLAAMADSPIATLEVHPAPAQLDKSSGISLHAASPLAQNLSQFIAQTAKPAAGAAATGEVLYRMVIPAKVAGQVAQNAVKPMASKAVAGGVHSALMGSKGIAAQAAFVPATGAGVAAAGAGAAAIAVAAPLVLMAVAVGVSARADHQRQQALERITELLEQLNESKLVDERNSLDGCRSAITKATTLLLDKGRIGISLGLDSAVYEIDKAIAHAHRRLKEWQAALAGMGDGTVDIGKLRAKFKGIGTDGGDFQTHLELAVLAIALKRRVIVIQAVDHAQLDEGNPFENFLGALHDDKRDLDELEMGIASVLRQLSTLQLSRRGGLRDLMLTSGEVDDLLRSSHQLHALGDRVEAGGRQPDVTIDIVRATDGSVIVLPARPAA
ncbi:hypothetical protein [Mycolicibacterium sphagni]|uniref:hypothetical protein n=1 Tax=Mycolicibacterium sphagni TaxID=1786 RepID=UPI0021F36E68|nr:hypothetical protein [Mycolicibacterium sphagni]MCV7176142.1 hypothetical protein [Mycolicibacterium sphagni]